MRTFALAALLVSASAHAHVPYIEGTDFEEGKAFVINGPVEKSLALYSSFSVAGDYDVYSFSLSLDDLKSDNDDVVLTSEGKPSRRITLATMVPACQAYAGILPTIALIGPAQAALPPLPEGVTLPVALNPGQGAAILSNAAQGAMQNEPISETNYWMQQEASWAVTEPGNYQVVAFEPHAAVGDYVLLFGTKEISDIKDTAQSVLRVPMLKKGEEITNLTCRAELKN